MKMISLEPTSSGYEQIARRFIVSMARDVSLATDDEGASRRAEALVILRELLAIVAYLSQLPDGSERITRLYAFMDGL